MRILKSSVLVVMSLSVSACFSPAKDLATGEAAYRVIPPLDVQAGPEAYRIGVLDVLSVRVFQEEELSFEEMAVDASGIVNFPLIGEVQDAGKTPIELSNEIEAGLATRFIRNPQVVVGVVSSAAQRVTVDGSVGEPGVYEIAGTSSLLESIARAQGTTNTAALGEVVIFRMIDGERYGAVFNLRHIREGKAEDPQILGGDRIVVGYSAIKGVYQDFLRAAPILNVFSRF